LRPCWTAPSAPATRPRRSEPPSGCTNARATRFPPPAATQVWSDWDTGQQSPTRSRRRESCRAHLASGHRARHPAPPAAPSCFRPFKRTSPSPGVGCLLRTEAVAQRGPKKLRNLSGGRRVAIRSSGEGLVPFVCDLWPLPAWVVPSRIDAPDPRVVCATASTSSESRGAP
jgi:hypothetical protein